MTNLSRGTFLLLFLFPFIVSREASNIVISEIAWTGTTISANDEWIELYNNTANPISLDGWQLIAQDETPRINLSGIIPANGFYLLERADDNTIPEILADKIYTGALGNNGELLKLYDSSGSLIDEIDCSSAWFRGNNKTKQTMERKNPQFAGSDPNNWQTSQNPGGTPKTKNSLVVQGLLENDSLRGQIESQPKTEPGEPTAMVGPQQAYPLGVVINEVLPSPRGPDEKEEWIELLNSNKFPVDISQWMIEDISGKISRYVFPSETVIDSDGFLVFSREKTRITLNNDGDGLTLIHPDGKAVDTVSYGVASLGKSFNRFPDESGKPSWAWSSFLTPNLPNKQEILEDQKKKLEAEATEGFSGNLEGFSLEKGIASVSGKKGKPLFGVSFSSVLGIAFLTSLFSGSLALFLWRKARDKKECPF